MIAIYVASMIALHCPSMSFKMLLECCVNDLTSGCSLILGRVFTLWSAASAICDYRGDMVEGSLRPATDDDMELVLSWRNREEVRKNMFTDHVISPEEHRAWWAKTSNDSTMRLLIFELDGHPAGVVIFSGYTGPGGLVTWGMYSGEGVPKGTGRKMEFHVLDYAFGQLQARRIHCEVISFNEPVIAMHQRYGFQLEGRLRQAYERDGMYFDIYKLGMLSTEWEMYVREFFEIGDRGCEGRTFAKRVEVTQELVDALIEGASSDAGEVATEELEPQDLNSSLSVGSLSMSVVPELVQRNLGIEGLVHVSQTIDFVDQVHVNDEVEIQMKVLADVGPNILVLVKGIVDDEVVVSGSARFLVSDNDSL